MTTDPEDWSRLHFVAGVVQQAGGLAWRHTQTGPEFVIVTSRRTGRWVLPKGSIDPGVTARGTVAQELFEEAGIIGEVSNHPIGSYLSPKVRPPLLSVVEANIYTVRITEVLSDWQESGQRERRFVGTDEATRLLSQPEMVKLVHRFADSLGGGAAQV